MRCIRVKFSGYKRLVDAGCNVDDRLVAFVGPNEAGKTSVLRALAWIDESGDEALPIAATSRGGEVSERDDSDQIVKADYRLEDPDLDAISEVGHAAVGSRIEYSYWRRRDGTRVHGLTPRLQREPEPFLQAKSALSRAPVALERALERADENNADDESEDMRSQFTKVAQMLARPDATWSESDVAVLDSCGVASGKVVYGSGDRVAADVATVTA